MSDQKSSTSALKTDESVSKAQDISLKDDKIGISSENDLDLGSRKLSTKPPFPLIDFHTLPFVPTRDVSSKPLCSSKNI